MNKRQWNRAIVLLCVIFHGKQWYEIAKNLIHKKYSRSHLFRIRDEVRRLYGF